MFGKNTSLIKAYTLFGNLNKFKVKIAIIGSRGYPFIYSGYETFVKELSERLVKKNIDVTVYCHRSLFNEKPVQVNGINLKYIPSVESKIFSQLSNSFLSFCHAIFVGYDIILTVNVANGPFGIITKLFGVKTVINVDGLEWLRPKWKGLGALYFKFSAKLATIFYDKIITDAQEMKKVYKKLFNTNSTVIAYGPKEILYSKTNILNKIGLKKLEYYLIVGRLIPDNNWDILVEGFKRSNTQKKLVIVGDNPFKNRFKESLKNNMSKNVIFTGLIKNQSELADLFKNAYVYLHGHEFGGTNPTLIEALSFGNAVIALDTPFNNEVLCEDLYGIYFSKNEDSVCKMINYADDNYRLIKKMKKNSIKAINKKFRWDHIVDEYEKVFRELI